MSSDVVTIYIYICMYGNIHRNEPKDQLLIGKVDTNRLGGKEGEKTTTKKRDQIRFKKRELEGITFSK